MVSYFVEVRILLTSPNYGNVTGILRTIWQGLLGVATIGSFLLAFYNLTTGDRPADGPATAFEITGENHDIDVHLHGLDGHEHEEPVDGSGRESWDEPVAPGGGDESYEGGTQEDRNGSGSGAENVAETTDETG